ncbi:MAG: hypothetical protein P1U77_21460 [Rubripirellula sp.]|nr:hypothetical protein [Rubripirellula sp.]
MRLAAVFTLLAFGLVNAPAVFAQSTISDRPWELTSTRGAWGIFLPDYELGENGSSSAFSDDMDGVGYFSDFKVVRRFLGTRTSFESNMFFGVARLKSESAAGSINVPDPATGSVDSFSGTRTKLKSDVNHYGIDLTLRDTWRTRFGGLSAGCSASYMAFDQKFDADYDSIQVLREKLDTDYLGGKAVFGWDGCFKGRASNLDLMIGYFDMDTDYRFIGQAVSGSDRQKFSKNAATVETYFTTRTFFHGYQIGWKVGAMYISDMPVIRHTASQRASIDTEDAVTFSGLIEILL